jgi:hypothetical protein
VASASVAVSPDTLATIPALFHTPVRGATDVTGFSHGRGRSEFQCIGLFGVRWDGVSILQFEGFYDETHEA